MKNKLDEIGNIRNSLAHFRPIQEGDVDLIKQNAKHTLSKIEETVVQLINCKDITPSNTEEEWFLRLSEIGNDSIRVGFQQSSDERWVKLFINYRVKPLSVSKYTSENYHYGVFRLSTNKLLISFPQLTKYLIFAVEVNPTSYRFDIDKPFFDKAIHLLFERKCLKVNHVDIRTELENCIEQISKESELVGKDNLARGIILDRVPVTAYKDGNRWRVGLENLRSRVSENDPPEYWGDFFYAPSDYFSSADTFPWMNVKIGDDKGDNLPF